MKRFKLNLIWLLIIFLVIIVGCRKNNNPTTVENVEPGKIPLFVPKMVQLPVALENKNDSAAKQTVTYIKTIDVAFDFRHFFVPVNNPDTSGQVVTWTVDSILVTIMATENDTGYQWVVVLNGTSDSRGIVYNDFLLMEMEQNSDGTAGKYAIHNLWTNSDDLLAESRWLTLQDGATYFETILYNDGRKVNRIEIVSNLDHSGNLKYYIYKDGSSDLLRFKAEWYIDGSGQCWIYDEMMNISFEGAW